MNACKQIGAYCFFMFDSPVIVYWFIPVMVISFGVMAGSYFGIFRTTSRTVARVASLVSDHNTRAQQTLVTLARRSFVFVLLFFVCWYVHSYLFTLFMFANPHCHQCTNENE
jgi:hypothetical protein